MSVHTTADEHRDKAKQHIEDAVKELSEIVVDRCWGWDDYCPEYLVKIKDTFFELTKLRDVL